MKENGFDEGRFWTNVNYHPSTLSVETKEQLEYVEELLNNE